jgi:hypothetical protein
MAISYPAVHDTLVAILVTVGIAVALSIAFAAAGVFFERSKAQAAKLTRSHANVPPVQHPTQSDDRELVLR